MSDSSNQQLIPFNFESKKIRVVLDDQGWPWFIAKDVCTVLGYVNTRQAIENLDADEKGVCIIDTLGGKQEANTINESGLYALVMRSNKPEAKIFRKWVTSEVIPSIRRTGHYQNNVTPIGSEVLTDEEYLKLNAREVRSNLQEFNAIGKELGLTGNQLTLSVARIIQKTHNGLDLLEIFGQQQQLIEPVQERHKTVSELGQKVGITSFKFNRLLEQQGFQSETRDLRNALIWAATEKGKQYSVLTVVTRANSDGTSQQLRWYESVLMVLDLSKEKTG